VAASCLQTGTGPQAAILPAMRELALIGWLAYAALAFGLRLAAHLLRTGSSGFKGVSGRPFSLEWLAGVGLVAAVALGVAAPLSDDVDPIDALDGTGARFIGGALYALGLAAVVASQQAMGRSWRIGVDEEEQTALITGGPFNVVRNPIFTAMIATQLGLALLVPSPLALAGVVLLLVSLELQTRLVEEPYLLRRHGGAYAAYARRVGRFLPGLGRLRVH
jgi:protein-S-isoprenylcysteine O-methyltransferase Ste14